MGNPGARSFYNYERSVEAIYKLGLGAPARLSWRTGGETDAAKILLAIVARLMQNRERLEIRSRGPFGGPLPIPAEGRVCGGCSWF